MALVWVLDQTLFNRTTRFVRTTEAGQRYLEDSRRIIGEVDDADEAVVGINAAPRGHLAVTAPVLFGRMFVLPAIRSEERRVGKECRSRWSPYH